MYLFATPVFHEIKGITSQFNVQLCLRKYELPATVPGSKIFDIQRFGKRTHLTVVNREGKLPEEYTAIICNRFIL